MNRDYRPALSDERLLASLATGLRRALEGMSTPDTAWVWGFTLLGLAALEARGLARIELAGLRSAQDVMAVSRGVGCRLPLNLAMPESVCPDLAIANAIDLILTSRACAPDLFADALLLGRVYQAWNAAEVRAVAPRTREGGTKHQGADITLATQLYTEPYMANFLLGAVPLENGDTHAPNPTVFDPACGAGHLLLPAFERCFLSRLGRSSGQSKGAIAAAVLNEQIFGLDIDRRAVDLCNAALWMRALELAPDFAAYAVTSNVVACDFQLSNVSKTMVANSASLGLSPLLAALENLQEVGALLPVSAADGFSDALLSDWVRTLADQGCMASNGAAMEPKSAYQAMMAVLLVLRQRYHWVLANPPYMGRKFMSKPLSRHLTRHFPDARGDLFAAFLQRGFALTKPGGMACFVTMKSWLYQASFAKLRVGLWQAETLVAFADLGSWAFPPERGLHEGVSVALTCWRHARPADGHEVVGSCVVGLGNPALKAQALAGPEYRHRFLQADLLALPGAPFVYDLPRVLKSAIACGGDLAGCVKQGLATTDNQRFVRYAWELPPSDPLARWVPCARGGTYRKWAGLDAGRVNWQADGAMIKALIPRKYPYLGGWAWVAKNANWYFEPGLTYGYMGYGALGARELTGAVFEVASIAVFPQVQALDPALVLAAMNARPASWMLRALSQKHMFQAGMTERLPLPVLDLQQSEAVRALVRWCVQSKQRLLRSDPLEGAHVATGWSRVPLEALREARLEGAWLHAAEGTLEDLICTGYGLTPDDRHRLVLETGTPVGWLPLVDGAAAPPKPAHPPPASVDLFLACLPRLACLSTPLQLSGGSLAATVQNGTSGLLAEELADVERAIDPDQAEDGPAIDPDHAEDEPAIDPEQAEDGPAIDRNQAQSGPLRGVPLPTETPIEALALSLGWHPLALLDLPVPAAEQKAWLEEALGVFVLALIGHPWPGLDGVGVAPEGVWSLVPGHGLERLADAVTALLAPGLEIEALLEQPLTTWLCTRFFRHHATAFKRRPIVWQLASRPARGRPPAFSCLVRYQALPALGLDGLVARYIVPHRDRLIAAGATDTTIAEIDALLADLASVAVSGFDTPQLSDLLQAEPLDSFAALQPGCACPIDQEAWHAAEAAYSLDLHDGVRVNMAPLQRAGILALPILLPLDLPRAIAQRALWRHEERAWCREGLLNAPGWWSSEAL